MKYNLMYPVFKKVGKKYCGTFYVNKFEFTIWKDSELECREETITQYNSFLNEDEDYGDANANEI